MHPDTSVPLTGEPFNLPLDRLVDEVRVLWINVLTTCATSSSRHGLALIHTRLRVLPDAEVSRLGKCLALIELVEVRCILVDRL